MILGAGVQAAPSYKRLSGWGTDSPLNSRPKQFVSITKQCAAKLRSIYYRTIDNWTTSFNEYWIAIRGSHIILKSYSPYLPQINWAKTEESGVFISPWVCQGGNSRFPPHGFCASCWGCREWGWGCGGIGLSGLLFLHLYHEQKVLSSDVMILRL